MDLTTIARLLFLLSVANGGPVIARDIFGKRTAQPLDFGAVFIDGQPLFGASKTIRGLVLAIAATSLCAPLAGLDWILGLRVGAAAMAGDLLSSFVKRRLRLPAGSRATGLDQIPESLMGLLACWSVLQLTVLDVATITGLFMAGEIVLSPLLFKLHLRDRPY
jgi:CDP-diglyceride synthetase